MPDIRLSKSSWVLIDTLKRVWNLRVNYVPIRLALGRSLYSRELPRIQTTMDEGRAIDTQQIFEGGGTDYASLYRALIVHLHDRALTDKEFLRILKTHIEHGFDLIARETKGFKNEDEYVDYLVDLTRKGLTQREQVKTH